MKNSWRAKRKQIKNKNSQWSFELRFEKNLSYAICEQQRCRSAWSACASAQSIQHLCCLLHKYLLKPKLSDRFPNDVAHLSRLMTKPTKWLVRQRRFRSAWAYAQSWLPSSILYSSQGLNLSSCGQRRLWSDCHFIDFVMSMMLLVYFQVLEM